MDAGIPRSDGLVGQTSQLEGLVGEEVAVLDGCHDPKPVRRRRVDQTEDHAIHLERSREERDHPAGRRGSVAREARSQQLQDLLRSLAPGDVLEDDRVVPLVFLFVARLEGSPGRREPDAFARLVEQVEIRRAVTVAPSRRVPGILGGVSRGASHSPREHLEAFEPAEAGVVAAVGKEDATGCVRDHGRVWAGLGDRPVILITSPIDRALRGTLGDVAAARTDPTSAIPAGEGANDDLEEHRQPVRAIHPELNGGLGIRLDDFLEGGERLCAVIGDDDLHEAQADQRARAPSENRLDRAAHEEQAAVETELDQHVCRVTQEVELRARLRGLLDCHRVYPYLGTGNTGCPPPVEIHSKNNHDFP